jgi:hypothetical protein
VRTSDELLAKILNVDLDSTAVQGLRLDRLKILLALSDVGAEADNIESLLDEPFQDDRGVEATGVRENDLLLVGGLSLLSWGGHTWVGKG